MIDYEELVQVVGECIRGMLKERARAKPKQVMKVVVDRPRVQRVMVEPVTVVQGKYTTCYPLFPTHSD
jgi:hypothetical protein